MKTFLPEMILFLTALGTVLIETLLGGKRSHKALFLTILGLAAALTCTILFFHNDAAEVFSRTLVIDSVSLFFKSLLIFTALTIVVLGKLSKEIREENKAEFYALIILATLGACIVSSAVHFLTLFIAYEMTSFIFCILAAFCRESKVSSEASMKMLVFGGVTSLLFLFGIVMIFGLTETFNILDIRRSFGSGPVPAGPLWVAFGLIFVAIATRMSLFPFHLLGPDVIEGAPTPTAAYLAIAPFLIGIILALRICLHVFSGRTEGALQWTPLPGLDWPPILAAIAAITMTISNLAALHQRSLKRLFGFSAISQMSYVLLGFVVINHMGLESVLFGAFTYVLATLGAFLVTMQAMDQFGQENISVIRGMAWKRPFEAVALSIFILSLAGLPPFAGFVSRVYLIAAVVKEQIYWLAIVTAVNSVIGLTFYFGLLRLIFEPSSEDLRRDIESATATTQAQEVQRSLSSRVTVSVLLLPTAFLGIYWDPLLRYISNSLNKILW